MPDERGLLVLFVERCHQNFRLAEPGGFKQVRAGGITVITVHTGLPHPFNQIRIMVEHYDLVIFCHQQPGNDLPDATDTGHDHGARFRNLVSLMARRADRSRQDIALEQDEKQRRQKHGNGNGKNEYFDQTA